MSADGATATAQRTAAARLSAVRTRRNYFADGALAQIVAAHIGQGTVSNSVAVDVGSDNMLIDLFDNIRDTIPA